MNSTQTTSILTIRNVVLIILMCLFMVTILYKYNQQLQTRQLLSIQKLTNVMDGIVSGTDGIKHRPVFSQYVLDFISEANGTQLKPVLIDPLMLYQMIDSKQQRVLLQNDLLSKRMLTHLLLNNYHHQYCTPFAMFSHDIPTLQSKLSQKLKLIGFKEVLIEGEDGSQRHYTKPRAQLPTTLLHAFYFKNQDCLQIAVLHKRHQFLWMGSVPEKYFNYNNNYENYSKIFSNKTLHYGRNESALDMFDVRLYEGMSSSSEVGLLFIPEPIVHFLAQLKTSSFTECNEIIAKNFNNKYAKNYTEDKKMDASVTDALLGLKRMARRLGSIPIYISSGTLLGWYRQCGVIPYTSDLDTATWAQFASLEATQHWLQNDVGFRLTYVYGLPQNGYQYAFYSRTNFRVDLFYTYNEFPNLTYTGHKPSQKLYFRYWYPYFKLCSAELVGIKVLVPCNAEDVVRAEYGAEWSKPQTSWSYMSSAYNTGPHRYWADDDEAKRAYIEF